MDGASRSVSPACVQLSLIEFKSRKGRTKYSDEFRLFYETLLKENAWCNDKRLGRRVV